MLANILIVDKCVTELIPGKLYAVKQGAAPTSILKTDVSHRFCLCLTFQDLLSFHVLQLERERELSEHRQERRAAGILLPLRQLLEKPTNELLETSSASQPPSTYLVNIDRDPSICFCADGIHRGDVHDGCKHLKAVHLVRSSLRDLSIHVL